MSRISQHRMTIVALILALAAGSTDAAAQQQKFPFDIKNIERAVKTLCRNLKREITDGNKLLSKGFDYANALAQYEPWAKHPYIARTGIADFAGCMKSILLNGEAFSFLKNELGLAPSRRMARPGSLGHKAAQASSKIWPALAVIESIALSLGRQDKALSTKQSLLRGMAKLIQRGATAKCIEKFAQNMTYGLISMDLAGDSERKKKALVGLAAANDAGIELMMKQCLSGVPEPCLPTCGPRASK